MRKHHPKNERIKRQYLIWLQEAKRLDPHSIDQIAAAISLFEASTNYKDFAAFHIEQARSFKKRQAEMINEATGKPLAKATIKSRFDAMKAFLFWLADQPGYTLNLYARVQVTGERPAGGRRTHQRFGQVIQV